MKTAPLKSTESRKYINKEGSNIFVQFWKVEKPIAVIALVHGLGEHSMRYDSMANYYNDRGIAVIAFDLRGHGQSDGKRGHVSNYEAFLDDVEQLLKITGETYPNVPVFLYGHSMGGNISINYVLRRKPSITGLIATGPSIRLPNPPSKLLIFFAKLIVGIFPGFSQSNGLDINGISQIPEEVEKYKNDPLVHDRITAVTALQLLKANDFLDKYEGEMPVPALLMHGSDDRLTSASGTEAFAKRVSGNVKFKMWDNFYHELHNDINRTDVYDYVINWIKKNLDKSSA